MNLSKLKLDDPKVRLYLYHVLTAVFALLMTYGVIGAEGVEAWLLVSSALLGMGGTELAAKNTPRQVEQDNEDAL